MHKKYIQGRLIKSIIALLIILNQSCFAIKTQFVSEIKLNPFIDDYLLEYSNLNNNNPEAMMIVFKSTKELKVVDYNLEHLYNQIRNKDDSTNIVTIGTYKDIPLILYDYSNAKQKIILEFLISKDSTLINKAEKVVNSTNSEEEIIFFTGPEYEPYLNVQYNTIKKIKILEYYDGTIRTEKSTPR